jgi:hypothetical protein
LYEAFVIFPVQFISFCATSALAYARQELVLRILVCSLIGVLSTFFGFVEMIQFENLNLLRVLSGGLTAVASVALIAFEGFNMFSKRKAAAHLKKDKKSYNKKWEEFNKLSRGTGVHPAQIVTDEIRKSFIKVLEDPNAASRWFRRQPRVLQEHSSVDNLFDDVELVDVAFQQLVHCWLNVSFSGSGAAASCLWF